MNILVTGSAGFIGFHLAKYLLRKKVKVIGLDNFNAYYDVDLKKDRNRILENYKKYKVYRGDLENLNLIKKIFSENKIDKVCHLAAQAGVRKSLTHPHTYIQSNLVGFTNLIEEAKNSKIKNFVYASSSSVYGGNKEFPSQIKDNVDKPISLYAATKRADELIAYTYHHLYNLNCTGLRYFSVIGPWGRPDSALFKFTKNILEGKPIEVYNYGKMERDFTYIDDIVKGTWTALQKSYPFEIFNLGGRGTVKLTYFIKCIEEALGKKAKRKMLPLQPGDVPKSRADIKEARQKLNYYPKTSVEEGIERFVEWYKEYYQISHCSNV